jgi:streptogramin lyase
MPGRENYGVIVHTPAEREQSACPWQEFVFQDQRHGNVHCVEVGGGFVWAGFCKKQSVLVRMTPDLREARPVVFDVEGGLHDLAFDGEFIWAAHSSGHLSRVDPATCEIFSYKLNVSNGQHTFLYALNWDGQHLWAGTYTEPGCVLRIDRESGQQTEFRIEAAPIWSVRTLVSTDKTLWVGLYTVPGKVVAIDKASGSQGVIDLGEDNMLCTSSAFDGRYVWLGLDTMPARLVRVDPWTREFRAYSLGAKSTCVRGLAFDGRYLWAGLYTEPGELVRFDPQTGDWRQYVMPETFFNTRALAIDGKRVWAVTQNIRYQPSGLIGLELVEVTKP